MKYIFALFGIVSCVALFLFIQVSYYIHISKGLIKDAVKFSNESSDLSQSLLVLGDSTAYGVGASKKEDSLPALVAHQIAATYVENHSVSGAKIEDLQDQIKQIQKGSYNLILIQIGANNIVARDKVTEESVILEKEIRVLQKLSKKIIFLSAGNLGGAPAIPFLFHPYYKNLTLAYHKEFQDLSDRTGVTYVNLYEDPSVDPFVLHPQLYFAKDKFHPSSVGYKYWFSQVEKYLLP